MSDYKINDKTLAFISDWKKHNIKQRRIYMALIMSLLFITVIICNFLYYWFQKKNYNRIVEHNMNYIQDSAIQETNRIERELENAQILIVNFAKRYASLIKTSPDTSVDDKLQMLTDRTMFDRVDFIAPDGTDTSLQGVETVYDREYFKDAMNGNSGYEYIPQSRITGQAAIIFYSPIIVDNEIAGVMAGFYEQNNLDNLFSYQFFNFTPDTYLLLENGTVIANSNNENIKDNILQILSQKKFTGDVDYEDIVELIGDEERITTTFSYSDGNKTKVGTIVQFTTNDWMILSVLPGEVTESMLSRADRSGKVVLFSIIGIFTVIVIVMFIFFREQEKRLDCEMNSSGECLREAIHKEEKQLGIIESLSTTYSSVYYIDLNDATYQIISEEEFDEHDIPDFGKAVDGIFLFMDKYVSGSYKEDMKQFLNIDTFRSRLAERPVHNIVYQRMDGGWRRGTLIKTGNEDHGRINYVIFAIQVIDEEKKKELLATQALQEAYEAAQMASNAKTTFLSNMSHDIRTPMNAIAGMTAIAAANIENTDKVSDCLKKITSSSKLLLGLINEVLDMSKIESGKVDLCEEEFNLSDLIDNLIQINQSLLKEKNHTLLVKINNLEHEDVVGDSTRLQQVFTNLLSNAIKYTPQGGRIEIIISEKETNKNTVGWYEVIFKDNGIGMPPEFVDKLFEPFTRARDDRINNIQGTGLGMPIAKNILKMMNGDIAVKSIVNEGTEFTVSFMLKIQKEEETDYTEFINLPVLVADDDVITCESTCNILNGLSMNSEWVTSGSEAVEKITERHNRNDDYYAVILDWKMPGMSGIETTREIRKQVGYDIPIIVISAYDWSDIEEEARAAGVNEFLSKPLFKSRLVNLFSELVGNKRDTNVKKEIQQYDFSNKRVLLVEDNELNREIAVEILSMTGLKTETAENGKIAVSMFSDSEPGYYDLIFMDIQMPVMNGYEATKEIRALNRDDAASIPIIAMSANAFSSDVREAYDAGMNGHISKPIDINRILTVLDEKTGGGGQR